MTILHARAFLWLWEAGIENKTSSSYKSDLLTNFEYHLDQLNQTFNIKHEGIWMMNTIWVY